MVESNHDLEGNIQLDTFEEEAKEKSGFRQENERAASRASSQSSSVNGETLNTLDEPVSETIVSPACASVVTQIWLETRSGTDLVEAAHCD